MKDDADPYVIALALMLDGRNVSNIDQQVSGGSTCVVVAHENVRSSKKIPAACRRVNIQCINVVELLRRENYRG